MRRLILVALPLPLLAAGCTAGPDIIAPLRRARTLHG